MQREKICTEIEVAFTKENLDFVMNGWLLSLILMGVLFRIVSSDSLVSDFPERFANGNPAISPEGVRPWDASITPTMLDSVGDLQNH